MTIYDADNNIHKFEWYFLIENKDIKYNFYYGVPHAHTSYSDGKGTPTEAYMHAKNDNLDFLIITDHSGSLVRSKLNKEVPNYEMLKIEADVINQKHNDFLALIGFETKTALWHHCNVINAKDVIGKKTRKKTEKLYDWLHNKDNIVLSINHPSRSCKNLPYLIEFDEFINLIEVGNGSPPREYRRSEEYYFKALDNGWHVGAINGQDNHSETWGDADNLTVVISDKLDIDSFINAMKLRRVYSTETRTLKLTVKGNDHWMGSILDLNKGDKLNLQIAAEDKSNPITKIQIISNGGNILNEKMFSKTNTAEWDLSFTITEDSSWYVVKVIHSNDKQGISSPIFVQTS
nr:CehA/McbA family metallohydrolase [Clostridium ganghwense]